jgi:hypothetical protein
VARPGSEPAPGDIVRDVIAEIAPAELPIVDGLRQLNPRAVRRRLRRRWRRRDPVGFGLEQVAVLMTPVAWIVVDEVTRRVTDDVADSYGGRITRALRAAIRRLTRRPAEETPKEAAVVPLSTAQLQAVRRRIIELAPKYTLTAEDAEALGDRVVARLVLIADTAPHSGDAAAAGSGPDPAEPDTVR